MFHIYVFICVEKYTIYTCGRENEMTLKLSMNMLHDNLDMKFCRYIFMGINL